MLCSLMNYLLDSFLPQIFTAQQLSQQLSEDRLTVDAVDKKIIKFVPYFFDLRRTLFLYDHLTNLPDLFLVRSKHSFSILCEFRSLKLNNC